MKDPNQIRPRMSPPVQNPRPGPYYTQNGYSPQQFRQNFPNRQQTVPLPYQEQSHGQASAPFLQRPELRSRAQTVYQRPIPVNMQYQKVPQHQFPQEQLVQVIDPDGRPFLVPLNQLQFQQRPMYYSLPAANSATGMHQSAPYPIGSVPFRGNRPQIIPGTAPAQSYNYPTPTQNYNSTQFPPRKQ